MQFQDLVFIVDGKDMKNCVREVVHMKVEGVDGRIHHVDVRTVGDTFK